MKFFHGIRGVAMLAGVLSYLYGDWNGLLIALIVAVCLDYATGNKSRITHAIK